MSSAPKAPKAPKDLSASTAPQPPLTPEAARRLLRRLSYSNYRYGVAPAPVTLSRGQQ